MSFKSGRSQCQVQLSGDVSAYSKQEVYPFQHLKCALAK